MKQKILHLIVILTLLFVNACALEKENTSEYADDASITTKIKTKILNERDLKAREIHVETYKKEVQLSGFVDTHKEAAKAEDLALNVKGVRSVQNDIKVRSYKSYKKHSKSKNTKTALKDSQITAEVKRKLVSAKNIDGLDINVKTNNGQVVLSGTLGSHKQAYEAKRITKQVKGVKSVVNNITVK